MRGKIKQLTIGKMKVSYPTEIAGSSVLSFFLKKVFECDLKVHIMIIDDIEGIGNRANNPVQRDC